MKYLWICVLLLPVLLNSCKDKNKIDPDAEEYFSFYADGEYFYYPQEKGSSLGVRKWQTLSAGKEGTTGYGIFAYSTKDPSARGGGSINFSGNHIPEYDTAILDGNTATTEINDLLMEGNSYTLEYPLTGKIIFTQRNQQKLTGTFEFEAYKYHPDSVGVGHIILTDTIIHITQGKFSIIPSN